VQDSHLSHGFRQVSRYGSEALASTVYDVVTTGTHGRTGARRQATRLDKRTVTLTWRERARERERKTKRESERERARKTKGESEREREKERETSVLPEQVTSTGKLYPLTSDLCLT
jgi:hypothetical protein